MIKHTDARQFRAWLLAGSALALCAGSALAQNSAPIESVTVTGSLIQRSVADAPTPTVVLNASSITNTGLPNLQGVLLQEPMFQMGSAVNNGDLSPANSNFLTASFGQSTADLRELGPSRTLVLVNGRRQVTGSPTDVGVDLNTIPTALVSRVDIITGGASATYGSDAVAGVINIILKDDFQGMAARLQTGLSSRGDGPDLYATATLGGNFAGDKGNVTLSVTYENNGKVMSKDRDLTSTDETWIPGLPALIGANPVLLGSAAFSSFGLGGRFQNALPIGPGGQIIASGSSYNPDGTVFNTAKNGFDRNPNRYIQVPVVRKLVAETGHYQLADNLRFFLEATYAETSSSQQLEPYPGTSTDGLSAPTSAGGIGILIPRTNPFIPAAVAAHFTSTSTGLFFSRRFADLGDRTGAVDRNMAKITFGFDGDIPFSNWKWSSYYEWGRTSENQTNGGYYDKVKLQEALNAHNPTAAEIASGVVSPAGGGGAVCNDPVAQAGGCVPVNLFGAGSITPQAAKYIRSLVTLQDWAEQQVASFHANGALMDLWAGPLQAAVGAEYRRESADYLPDSATQSGTVAGNSHPETKGAYDVKEVFGEGIMPLLKDMPFAQYVELNGAARYAHYSSAGNATSWRYGLIWQPITELKFRANESSATRAPDVAELYLPNSQTFPSISITADPCIHPSDANVIANCNQAIAKLGAFIPGEPANPSYTQSAAQSIGGYQSGNPQLKPEQAHTLTAGVVWAPDYISGLTASVDWYDIRLHGSIAGLSAVSTLAACYQGPSADFNSNVFCQQITRQHDPNLGPIIKQINFPTFNLGSQKTSGVDFNTAYVLNLADLATGLEDAGTWTTNLTITYLDSYSTDPGLVGTSESAAAGTLSLPHWRGVFRGTYAVGPASLSTTLQYIGGLYVDKSLGLDLPGNRIVAQWYLNLHAAYEIIPSVEIYAGLNNAFDHQPPAIFPGAGYEATGTGTDASTYDVIGRFWYTGLSFKM